MFSSEWNSAVPGDETRVAEAALRIRQLKRDFRERINAFAPVGLIDEWDTETAPDGWKECNGQSLAVADHPDLFLVLGYRYGGSGANFNVMDLRGLFVRCLPNGVIGRDKDCHTTIQTTCTMTDESPVITVVSTENLKVGMDVTAPGIPDDTHILTVDSGVQLTLTNDATATGSGVAVTFTHLNVFCVGDISGTAVSGITGLLVCPRLGAEVSGTGIAPGTVISALPSFDSEGIPTAITLSQAAANGSDIAITINNDVVGSVGYDANKSHIHSYTMWGSLIGSGAPGSIHYIGYSNSSMSGGDESRPENYFTMYIIRTDAL
jgi:microcystin-dependent protein